MLCYEGLLAPLGSCFLLYINGGARTNLCDMGTLLWFVRLLLALGHKLAANCCAGSSGGAATGTATRTRISPARECFSVWRTRRRNPFVLYQMSVAKKYGLRWRDWAAQKRVAREKTEEASAEENLQTRNDWNELYC